MNPNPNPNENPNPAASDPAPAVHIYADGACSGNPGPGGWGAVLMCPEQGLEKRMSGAAAGTTNNRMELTAVIQGLMALKRPCRVTVTTDSRYVVDAFEKNWLAKWQRNGWRTAGRQPVKNEDLWRELLEAMSTHRVSWRWIRGHAGHPENELADRLAVAARQGGSGAVPAGKPASGRKSPCGKGKGRPGGKPKRPGRGLPA